MTATTPRPRLIPLNAQQHALWFVHQLAPSSSAYAVGLGVRLRGPLDPDHWPAPLRR